MEAMKFFKNICGFSVIFFSVFSLNLANVYCDDISTPGQNASNASITIDPIGNVVAVWVESGIVKSNSANAEGSWSSNIDTLSGSEASFPQVQIDQSGTATAIWVEKGMISSSSMPLNGSWSTPVVISGASASSPALAIDLNGNLVAVWVEAGFVTSATKLYGESWSLNTDTLSASGASLPQVAIGSEGTVTVVWQGLLSATPTIYAATKMIRGTWSGAVPLSAPNVKTSSPQVSVDPQGNSVAIWYSYELTDSVYSSVIVQASTMLAGNDWSAPENISSSSIRNPLGMPLRVSAGSNGCALASWTSSYNGSTFSYMYSVLSKGNWSVPIALISNNMLACFLNADINSNDDVIVVWMRYDELNASLIIEGAVNDIASSSKMFAAPWTLSASGNNAYPVVSISFTAPYFYGAAAWESFNGTNDLIQAATLKYRVVQPPSNLQVIPMINDFGVISQINNVLSWDPSPTEGVINYLIFRNGTQIGWTGSNTLTYVDANRIVGETVNYAVAATDDQACESSKIYITFTN